MSNKTLYEIYNDIRNSKEVEKEDLKMAILMYRDLLWFSNHDIEEIYKANTNSLAVELRYKQSVERYQKALKQQPRIWLGQDGIPGTQEYKEKEQLCNNILRGFEKYRKELWYMEDHLVIGVDISNGKSISVLTVARHCKGNIEVVNQFYDEEAEELYYKLINIHTPDIEEIKNKAIAKSMVTMKKLYSQKELLELIEETRKLQDYTEKERNYILAHNTPSKIKEMLTYFWLTHTNDVFFNYFGFNWVPPMELQEKVRKKMNNINKTTIDIEIPFLKSLDAENVIVRNEMLNAANKLMYDYSMLPKELFNNNLMKGATNED